MRRKVYIFRLFIMFLYIVIENVIKFMWKSPKIFKNIVIELLYIVVRYNVFVIVLNFGCDRR